MRTRLMEGEVLSTGILQKKRENSYKEGKKTLRKGDVQEIHSKKQKYLGETV